MTTTRLLRWLFAAALVAGCGGAAEPPSPTSTPDAPLPLLTFPTPTPVPAAAAPALPTADTAPVAAELPTVLPAPVPTVSPWSTEPHPLQIEVMRRQTFPGSAITVEQTLEPGANYSRAVVSYLSDGYKVYALMTVPDGPRPESGWPAIVFNHGYIGPDEYSRTDRYVAYVDAIARSGYVVFMSDYRGWANSEGGESIVGGGYGNAVLTADVLNAVASLQAHADVDPNRIGAWGHSMGGQLVLRAMVVSSAIKAGVIWGGVVTPYPDIIARWGRMRFGGPTAAGETTSTGASWWGFGVWVEEFSAAYGAPEANPGFWATISPNSYLAELSGPIQLHHSTTDEMVPLAWAQTLETELSAVGVQPHELYTYEGDNHNISANFDAAMQRTIAFFDTYVKGQ